MRLFTILLSLLLCLSLHSKKIVLNAKSDIQKQFVFENSIYIINENIDLHGKKIALPKGATLIFKDGHLSNGTIIGSMTKISYNKFIFKDVDIKGTWNVPIISTSIFYKATLLDVLKNVLALAHKNIRNTIYIQSGVYSVTAIDNTKGALYIPSNTTLIINGTISLKANNYQGCSVLYINNANNVCIKGNGKIIGDKNTHTGTKGEWGMGVQIMHGRNINIQDLDISNCWGDCIYIGGQSSNLSITNCNLHNARRQGISVTHAYKVSINKCVIHDILGTSPEYGIDFEPNANNSVHYMTVNDTEIYNCKGGIIAGIKGVTAKNASVGDITINRCYIHDLRTDNTFRWHNCSNIKIADCVIDKYLNNCSFSVDAKNIKYKNVKRICK